jgi:hypothetical protein
MRRHSSKNSWTGRRGTAVHCTSTVAARSTLRYAAHAQTEQQLGWTEGDSCTGTVAARSTLRYTVHAQTEQQDQLGWTEGDSCTGTVAARSTLRYICCACADNATGPAAQDRRGQLYRH